MLLTFPGSDSYGAVCNKKNNKIPEKCQGATDQKNRSIQKESVAFRKKTIFTKYRYKSALNA